MIILVKKIIFIEKKKVLRRFLCTNIKNNVEKEINSIKKKNDAVKIKIDPELEFMSTATYLGWKNFFIFCYDCLPYFIFVVHSFCYLYGLTSIMQIRDWSIAHGYIHAYFESWLMFYQVFLKRVALNNPIFPEKLSSKVFDNITRWFSINTEPSTIWEMIQMLTASILCSNIFWSGLLMSLSFLYWIISQLTKKFFNQTLTTFWEISLDTFQKKIKFLLTLWISSLIFNLFFIELPFLLFQLAKGGVGYDNITVAFVSNLVFTNSVTTFAIITMLICLPFSVQIKAFEKKTLDKYE